jgi:cystathionine gamma-synthase
MASQPPKRPDKGIGISTPGQAGQRLETIAVTAGRPPRDVDAPFNQPVVFASTYVGTHEPGPGTVGYGRYGNPTWDALEEALGRLEAGRALTFASGMARRALSSSCCHLAPLSSCPSTAISESRR